MVYCRGILHLKFSHRIFMLKMELQKGEKMGAWGLCLCNNVFVFTLKFLCAVTYATQDYALVGLWSICNCHVKVQRE